MSEKPFTLTVNAGDGIVTIIKGADYIDVKVADVEALVTELRTTAWMAGNVVPLVDPPPPKECP